MRQIANAIAGWIDRLGAVWVEGQVAQVSRRPGMNTVFLTLRDAVADISVPVTCSRTLFDGLNPPLVEGAQRRRPRQAVLLRQPRHPLARTPARSGWSASASCSPGSSGAASCWPPRACSPPELKRPLPFLPGCVGLVTAPNSAAERDVLENARRRWPAVRFEVAYAAMQGTRAARRGDRGGRAGSTATPTST